MTRATVQPVARDSDRAPAITLAVTGTDTGVGKTVVACAVAAALSRRGLRVGVMKPVETGVRHEDERDATLLRAAAASTDPMSTIGPMTFPAPVAPLAAARRVGATIDVARLDNAFHTISRGCDALIVEGAGGLLVPITPEIAFDALFHRWQLPIVVVAANRLGVLNHTRLTVAAAMAASLNVSAVVLKNVEDDRSDPSTIENADLLRELLPNVPIVELPRIANARDWDGLASIAEQSGLIGLLTAS